MINFIWWAVGFAMGILVGLSLLLITHIKDVIDKRKKIEAPEAD